MIMDATTAAGCPKRLKIEGQCSGEKEDKISDVPDSVLHYILSFLPAKQAVCTSILSTRWRYLWTAIHTFEFDDGLRYASKKLVRKKERPFFEFVNKVLFVNDVSNIQRFSLTCRGCDELHFSKWMSTVMRRKVQELSLAIKNKPPFCLRYDLFNFELLRVMKIDMEVTVDIPSFIFFPNLKVLDLKCITFTSAQMIQEVSLSCPILEDVILNDWNWLKVKRVNISVPTLQRLKIYGRESHGSHDCEIRITAESLRYIKLDMVMGYEYSLCNLSSLVDAYLDFPAYNQVPNDTIAHRLDSLLSGIYNVRNLELSLKSIETLSLQALSPNMRSLSRLKHLTVDYGFSTSGRKLIELLSNMPHIESLRFSRGLNYFVFKGNGRILGTTPRWFLSKLKSIEICYFKGTRDQQWFIKFLIKSVRVVDNWKLKLLGVVDKGMIAKLEMLAIASKCVLEFN